jgi:FkbM family methyltransferase
MGKTEMKKPHWARLLKHRWDFFRHYLKTFGPAGAARVYYRIHRAPETAGRLISIKPPGVEWPVLLRAGTSDISTFEKIFVWNEYAVPFVANVDSIVDCGANTGLAALWFAVRFPNARVIAVEPDAANFDLLRQNTGHCPNVTPVRSAVWNKPCRLRVENPQGNPDSFRFAECSPADPGSVEALDLKTLQTLHGLPQLDIVKIDIEGGEQAVFSENFSEWLDATRMLLIEFHGENMKQTALHALSQFHWRHSVSGENDCFVKTGKEDPQ